MGCPKCQLLTANAENAARELGLELEVVKVTDLKKISDYGVMMTPALVIDGVVRSVGKVLPVEEIKKLLR